jgi:hypothetical protein
MTEMYTPRDWASHPPPIFPAFRSTMLHGPTNCDVAWLSIGSTMAGEHGMPIPGVQQA